MADLKMHIGIAHNKLKDVLAGNKPPSARHVREALPWVSEAERKAYMLLNATLYPISLCRDALPASLKRKLLLYVRSIDASRVSSAFRSTYLLPTEPSATGSGYELYVCMPRIAKYPPLAVRIHKSTRHSEARSAHAQFYHEWHQSMFPDYTSWQASTVRSLGKEQQHHIIVSEYVHIHADICAGHSPKGVRKLESLFIEEGETLRKECRALIQKMRELASQGIYLDIGGKNNIVIFSKKPDTEKHVRIVDTGLVGFDTHVSAETRELFSRNKAYVSTVTPDGGHGTWSSRKYIAYLNEVEEAINRAEK